MSFLSFFCPKNDKRKRIEKNLNPSFSVRRMILALDRLPSGRAYLHPHMDRTKIFKTMTKGNILTSINI